MARNVLVKIEGDATSLTRAFDKSSKEAKKFDRDIGKIGRGALGGSGLFRGLGRSIAFASTAFLGGFGLVTAIRASLEAMSDLENVSAQTEATLKSTGEVAGVTAEHIAELGEKMSNLTGVNQAEVRSAENLLLTFTNVRNVAGKNNLIFDRATRAALDLSAALHTDLRSATLLVGKALQNPIKGLQQLNRATGGLSESQTKLVRRLVAAGNVMGAQKVILRDLNKSFGGAAEVHTLSADLAVLQNNLSDLGAKIAEEFAPELHKVLDSLDKWITNTENQDRVLDDSKQVIGAVGDVLGKLHSAFNDLNKITGSTKHSVGLLIGAFVAFKGLRILTSLTTMAADLGLVGSAAQGAAADVAIMKTELALPTTLNTKLGTTAGGIAGVGTAAATSAGEVAALNGQLAATGVAAGKSTGKVAALAGGLGGLGALGEIAIPVLIAVTIKQVGPGLVDQILPEGKVRDVTKKVLFSSMLDVVKEANKDLFDPLGKIQKGFEKGANNFKRSLRGLGILDAARGVFDTGADVPRGKELKRLNREAELAEPPGEPPGGLTKKQLAEAAARRRQAREALRQQVQDQAELRVDRATLTKGTADDIAALKSLQALLTRRAAGEQAIIDNQKSSQAARARAQQALLANEKDLIGVQKQLADLQEQAAQNRIDRLEFGVDVAKATAGLGDDLAALSKLRQFLEQRLKADKTNLDLQRQIFDINQEIADVQKRRRDARQFKALGLGPTGEDLVPGVKNLKNQLKSVRDAIDGSFLDTRKTRGLLGHIRQILAGGLGSVSAEVRSKVAAILADLKDQLKQSSVDVTKFQASARGQFTLAGAHPGRFAGAGGGITINGGIHLHGVQDVKALENALQKRRKQRARARGGTR